MLSQRDIVRKKRLYDQGHKYKFDRPQDLIDFEREKVEYTFTPNHVGTSAANIKKKASTPSGSKSTRNLRSTRPTTTANILANNTDALNKRSSFQP